MREQSTLDTLLHNWIFHWVHLGVCDCI
uniref:Uncharacterized protein n=1 Tax=Anguilla anguilla TaxID=7936 RepID=A0A0E9U2N7_ANGAN